MSTLNFKNRAGNTGVLNEGLVGGIVEDDGIVGFGVGNPGFELLAGSGGAGRVVWVAEVDQVGLFIRDGGHKAILGGAGEVDEALVGAIFISFAGVASHDVGVYINGVDGVGDGDFVILAKDVEDVAGVAF